MIDPEILRKMDSGEIYDSGDFHLMVYQEKCVQRVNRYNRTNATPLGFWKRNRLLKKMFASIGEDCYIEPPFHANFGAIHVHLGDHVYANFNLTLVDDGQIFIGDNTMIGPNVTLCTAAHPILPEIRKTCYQYNLPVHIGKNCWLGAGVIVLPGVTIGEGCVIGAGSVVNKDIPPHVIAVGVPAKVLRPIGERDREFYHGQMKVPEELKPKE
jgi:galactoside O-acetyltransferase